MGRQSARRIGPALSVCALLAAVVVLLIGASGASAVTRADLAVVRMTGAPNPAYVGNDLTYTVVVKNNERTRDAGGADLVTTIPEGVSFVSAQTSVGGDCRSQVGELGGKITCAVNGLEAQESRTVTIVLALLTSGNKQASAKIRSKAGGKYVSDPKPANDSRDLTGPTKQGGTEVRGRDCTENKTGTTGANIIEGTAGDDVICGLSGNDTIAGLGGNDIIYGGRGNDVVDAGDGDDLIRGGPDDDQITGRAGTDTVSYVDGLASRGVDLESPGPNPCNTGGTVAGNAFDRTQDGRESGLGCDALRDTIENAMGSQFGDFLTGSALNNTFWGLSGSDVIAGEGGTDDAVAYYADPSATITEYGARYGVTVDLTIVNERQDTGEGYDTLKEYPAGSSTPSIDNVYGSKNNDVLYGNPLANELAGMGGNDELHGLQGNDELVDISGKDALFGDDGSDDLDARDQQAGEDNSDSVDGGAGTDTCLVDGSDTRDGCP